MSISIDSVRKRDGRIEPFNPQKITNAIFKALKATGEGDYELAEKLSSEVVKVLNQKFAGQTPSVEEIQDIVEDTLIRHGLVNSAKAYILYRRWRTSIRETKRLLGVEDDLKLTINAVRVLARRYLLRDEQGRIIETPGQMFMRVAKAIARADSFYGSDPSKAEKQFFQVMRNLEFLPNSPTLMNAGTEIGQLAACFVLPVEDSIEGIFDALKYMAIIHKSGGGCVAKGTLIYTTLCGLVPIEDLVERFIPLQLKDVDDTISIDISDKNIHVLAYEPYKGANFKKILRVWRYKIPRKNLVKITFSSGAVIITSTWHPFLVLNKEGSIENRRADELRPGDVILMPSRPLSWPFENYIEVNNIKITESLAWALGYLLGDGSLDKNRVRAFDESVEPLKKLKQVLSETFNDNIGCIYMEKRYPMWIYQTYNQRVVSFLNCLLKTPDGEVKVPSEIFKSPLSVILAFLAGIIDSEGYVDNDRVRIEIAMTSLRPIELLAALLNAIGLRTKLQVRKSKGKSKKDLYRLVIEPSPALAHYSALLLRHLAKNKKKNALRASLAKIKHKRKVDLHFNALRNALNKLNIKIEKLHRKVLEVDGEKIWLHRWLWGHSIDGDKLERTLGLIAKELYKRGFNDEANRLIWLSEAVFNVVKVKSVKKLEGEDKLTLYDLTVEDCETYIAGSKGLVVVHNTGFSFSRLRPKGDIVKSTMGVASGPVSFMKIFDVATEVIKQGGKRRGANMGVLRVDHPDIREFITVKSDGVSLRNFNISVAVTDKFMQAVESGGSIDLINPRTKEPVKTVSARDLFDLIVDMAWRIGDPGLLFIDEINRKNPTPKLGEIEATNPCITGETRILTPLGYIKAKDLFEAAKQLNIKMLMASRGISEGGEPIAYEIPILLPLSEKVVYTTAHGKQLTLNNVECLPAYIWKIGKRKIVKIKTKEGYELIATPDHKVATVNGWKKIKELKTGDKILIARIDLDDSFGAISIGKDLAFALGWLIGDGCLSSDKVIFYFNEFELDIASKIIDTLSRRFNVKVLTKRYGNTIRVYAKGAAFKYFKQLLNNKCKCIPEIVYRLKPREIASFLRGLFTADGYVDVDGAIRLTSKHEHLLREVQNLLLLFGIKSKIYRRPYEKIFKYRDRHGEIKLYMSKGYYELVIANYSRKLFAEKIGFEGLKSLKIKIKKAKIDSPYVIVKSIEDAGEDIVYDFTVPYFKCYVSNGFISHNCGEVPLLPFEACNLGSINLSKIVKNGDIDWDKLRELVWIAVHFLDNVIDVNKYPLPQIERMVKLNRKIGLGVMGFADMLLKLGIPYDSDDALNIADKIMGFIASEGKKASRELALERGVFPSFEESHWKAEGYDALRNATVTSIAPTGTISIIAGTSSSIEPIFAPVYVRKALGGINLIEVNPIFERVIREKGIYSGDLLIKVAKTGSLREVPGVPDDVKRLMATALDIDPEWHVKMQATFQKHVDNAVAKTVNLRYEAGLETVRKVFMLAYKLKCKGITVYRYGSKPEQVLYVGLGSGEEADVTLGIEYLEQCPKGVCFL
ncbi:MAG: intein-containing adenosylcobalamin-dependent ribonucleoside-diphosphate reductase [Thermoprotei archaeon]|nr:MAG: intein-containing adenosylcobalamin-dependent ribonucleoside-diphosphate reductase [Thermoprotei archaeon]